MASSAASWDLTGKTVQLPTGSKSGTSTSTGGGTSTSTEVSSQSQFVSKQNTPDFALGSLEDLIAQLSDRPVLSDEEAAAQFPLSQRVFDKRAGWGYDMGGGRIAYGPQAQSLAKQWDEQQLAKRKQAQQASGVIQGGTAATREGSAARSNTLQTLQKGMGQFSKEAAFADAGDLAARFQRQLMETLMPNINKAIEGSGTSGGAVSGLLANDAAARVAEAQAALGLETAVQYGQLSNQMASILAELSNSLPPELKALLEALGISKGTIEQGVAGGSSVATKTTNTQESKTTDAVEQQQGGPGGLALPAGLRIGASPGATGPVTTPQVIGATPSLDKTLQDLARRDTFGGGYQF